jgi:hypothetical protein
MDRRRGEAESAGKNVGRGQQNNAGSVAQPITRVPDYRPEIRDVDREVFARTTQRGPEWARRILNSCDDCVPERRGHMREEG